MALFRLLALLPVVCHSKDFFHSDHPYYRTINCNLTSEDWIHRNLSYPWLTLLALEDEFTHTIQHLIYSHQNPSYCEDKKYLVTANHRSGLGSCLHVSSEFYPKALLEERIMIFSQDWRTWTEDVSICSEFQRNPDCYFESVSNCSEFVFKSKSDVKYQPVEAGNYHRDTAYGITEVSGWRAQWTKYIFKPKQGVLDLVRAFIDHHLVRLGPQDEEPLRLPVDSHPPLNSIGIHVRHGDKWKEMKLKSTF